MNCMKCGRETKEEQAFCPACLDNMEQYPVKPGTVILLPTPAKPAPKKVAPKKKPAPPAEEQVITLKKTIRRLYILIFFMLGIIAGLGFITRRAVTELDIQRLLGQNYSTAAPATPGITTASGQSGKP